MTGFKRITLLLLAFSGFMLTAPAIAQVPKSVAASFAPIVKRVTPSVVNVYAARV